MTPSGERYDWLHFLQSTSLWEVLMRHRLNVQACYSVAQRLRAGHYEMRDPRPRWQVKVLLLSRRLAEAGMPIHSAPRYIETVGENGMTCYHTLIRCTKPAQRAGARKCNSWQQPAHRPSWMALRQSCKLSMSACSQSTARPQPRAGTLHRPSRH